MLLCNVTYIVISEIFMWWFFEQHTTNAVCHVVLGVVANGGGSKSVKADGETITPAYPGRTTQHTCIERCRKCFTLLKL